MRQRKKEERVGGDREGKESEQSSFKILISAGVKSGCQWRRSPGGCYLAGEVDSQDRPEGSEVIFLYPDLLSVVTGTFSQGKLISGHYGHLTGILLC